MFKKIGIGIGAVLLLSGCVATPGAYYSPYAGYVEPAPYYGPGYSPAYVGGPAVVIGGGGYRGYRGGWGGWGHGGGGGVWHGRSSIPASSVWNGGGRGGHSGWQGHGGGGHSGWQGRGGQSGWQGHGGHGGGGFGPLRPHR